MPEPYKHQRLKEVRNNLDTCGKYKDMPRQFRPARDYCVGWKGAEPKDKNHPLVKAVDAIAERLPQGAKDFFGMKDEVEEVSRIERILNAGKRKEKPKPGMTAAQSFDLQQNPEKYSYPAESAENANQEIPAFAYQPEEAMSYDPEPMTAAIQGRQSLAINPPPQAPVAATPAPATGASVPATVPIPMPQMAPIEMAAPQPDTAGLRGDFSDMRAGGYNRLADALSGAQEQILEERGMGNGPISVELDTGEVYTFEGREAPMARAAFAMGMDAKTALKKIANPNGRFQ